MKSGSCWREITSTNRLGYINQFSDIRGYGCGVFSYNEFYTIIIEYKMIDNALNKMKVKRGEQLPISKLTDANIRYIFGIVEKRERLREELSTMTNKAIAVYFGVHQRTIDKVTSGYSWTHVEGWNG